MSETVSNVQWKCGDGCVGEYQVDRPHAPDCSQSTCLTATDLKDLLRDTVDVLRSFDNYERVERFLADPRLKVLDE